jgi:hypothetical protein
MTGRRVGALLVAALVVIALGLWASSRKIEDSHSGAGAPVINGLKAQVNDVTEVRISRGDGSKATLRKGPTNWVVAEREYPADSGKVRKLLLDLSKLEVVETKTSDPAKYAQLGVEDVTTPTAGGTRVELVTPEKVHGVIVGRTSGMKSGYVRATDEKQSVLATPQLMLEADPQRWIDTALVDIADSRIREVEVTPASGPAYKLARENKDQADFTVTGVPKGRELSSPSAASTVSRELAGLTLTDVRKPAAAAAATSSPLPSSSRSSSSTASPKAVFRTFDGLEIQLQGRQDGERRYVVVTSQSTAKETADEATKLTARTKDWEFEIPNYKYDGIFKPIEELLKPKDEKK